MIASLRRAWFRRVGGGGVGIAALALLAGCDHRPTSPPPGRHVAPRRIVSLAPSCTETLVALGVAPLLVGISDYCPELPAGCAATRVGGLENLNVEALLELDPDLVLTVQAADDRGLAAFRRLGVAVRGSNPQSLAAMLAEVEALAVLVGVAERGRELAASLHARLDAIARDPAARIPTIYVEVDEPGCFTIGHSSFVHEAVAAAGGLNVFGDVAQDYFQASQEALLARAPDVVLLLHPIGRPLAERPEIAGLAAFRNGRVIADFDRDSLLRSSPRLVDGIEALHRRLATP
ncbi:MAG: hypothetical protein EXS13_01880 [Planctomycetes bacterium]|nr:hypothetical protein [Planctomycetota bacterium]